MARAVQLPFVMLAFRNLAVTPRVCALPFQTCIREDLALLRLHRLLRNALHGPDVNRLDLPCRTGVGARPLGVTVRGLLHDERGPLLGWIHHHIGHLTPLIHRLVPGRTGLIIGGAAHHHGSRGDCHRTERGSRYRRTNDRASDSPGRIGSAGTIIPSIAVTMVIIGPVLPVLLLLLPVVLPVLLLLLPVALPVFAIGRLAAGDWLAIPGRRTAGWPAGWHAATAFLGPRPGGWPALLALAVWRLSCMLERLACQFPLLAAPLSAKRPPPPPPPPPPKFPLLAAPLRDTPPPPPPLPPRWASTGATTNTPIKIRPLQAVRDIHRCVRMALTVLSLLLRRAASSAAGQRRSLLPPRAA